MDKLKITTPDINDAGPVIDWWAVLSLGEREKLVRKYYGRRKNYLGSHVPFELLLPAQRQALEEFVILNRVCASGDATGLQQLFFWLLQQAMPRALLLLRGIRPGQVMTFAGISSAIDWVLEAKFRAATALLVTLDNND